MGQFPVEVKEKSLSPTLFPVRSCDPEDDSGHYTDGPAQSGTSPVWRGQTESCPLRSPETVRGRDPFRCCKITLKIPESSDTTFLEFGHINKS